MKSSFVFGLVIVACAVASYGADALPRGSESMKQRAMFVDGLIDYDDAAEERVSCDYILQQIVDFIKSLMKSSDGTMLVRNSADFDDLINDILEAYSNLLNPNARMSPIVFAKIFRKLSKVIPAIINVIDKQLPLPTTTKNPIVTVATTTVRNGKGDYQVRG